MKHFLKDKGIEIIELAFSKFDPKHRSSFFRNAYYKLEVINELGILEGYSILLDADCIWTRHSHELLHLLTSTDTVLLKNLMHHDRGEEFYTRTFEANKSLKKIYNTIHLQDISSQGNEVQYGGEFIATNQKNFQKIGMLVSQVFQHCIEQYDELEKEGKHHIINNMFNGDEHITSFVYSNMNIAIKDIRKKIISRLWTADYSCSAKATDLSIPIWHLVHEKQTGFIDMFDDLTQDDSLFWQIEDEYIPCYLGAFIGIPNRWVRMQKYERDYALLKLKNLDWVQFANMSKKEKIAFIIKKIARKI